MPNNAGDFGKIIVATGIEWLPKVQKSHNLDILNKRVIFRLDQVTDSSPEKLASTHIKNLILKSVCPVLKNFRSSMESIEDFKQDFGSIGIYGSGKLEHTLAIKYAWSFRLNKDFCTFKNDPAYFTLSIIA